MAGGHEWQRRGCTWQGYAWQGGMHGGQGGHVWCGACMAGGCVAGGHVWQGTCMAGGCVSWGACVAGGHAWQGACMMMVGYVWQGGLHAMYNPWQILQDTVNERAVCIILECIFVIIQMTKVVQFLCTLYVLFYENLSNCVFAVESNVISKH